MKSSHNSEVGKVGEMLAAEYLKSLGMEVIDQNWKRKHNELDIVAIEGNILRFVEVKSRTEQNEHTIRPSLGQAKLRSITKAASQYISANYIAGVDEIYFDLITIIFYDDSSHKLEYTPRFFYPSW